MHAFDVLGDPVRRRIVELLAEGERTAGDLTERVQAEFGISQPAVSRHLRVLRDAGFVTCRTAAQQRIYRLEPRPLQQLDAWLAPYRRLWEAHLDALEAHLDNEE